MEYPVDERKPRIEELEMDSSAGGLDPGHVMLVDRDAKRTSLSRQSAREIGLEKRDLDQAEGCPA